MAGCGGLRRQILEAAGTLSDYGVHVPSAVDDTARSWHNFAWDLGGDKRFDRSLGSLAQAADEARRLGRRTLLLMSEEFETALVGQLSSQRLADLVSTIEGRATVLLVFRHQLSYLNLVFAFRAINGGHATWFEDFVRSPRPPHQFDYLDVVERFDIDPRFEVVPLSLDDVAAGGGLGMLLGRAGVDVPELADGRLDMEWPPPTMHVHASLMAHRLATRRLLSASERDIRQIARNIGRKLSRRFPDAGPYWGWTDDLLQELLPTFEEHNARFSAAHGVSLRPDAAPAGATDLHLRNANPAVVKTLIDALNGATRA